jgi:hypothetical protein
VESPQRLLSGTLAGIAAAVCGCPLSVHAMLQAERLGKPREDLLIYDPYYCAGGVANHLAEEGFTNVYNRNEDFYAVVSSGRVPPVAMHSASALLRAKHRSNQHARIQHDVVVTNPPYSVDHVERLLCFLASDKKPFLLLCDRRTAPHSTVRERNKRTGVLGCSIPDYFGLPPEPGLQVQFRRRAAPRAHRTVVHRAFASRGLFVDLFGRERKRVGTRKVSRACGPSPCSSARANGTSTRCGGHPAAQCPCAAHALCRVQSMCIAHVGRLGFHACADARTLAAGG